MKISFKKFIPGIAWFFMLLILLCIPGDDLPPAQDWFQYIFLDKWIHAGLFGLLALLFMAPILSGMPVKKKIPYAMVILLVVIIWGLITEFIQHYFISGRSFDINDWLADATGAIIAYFFSKHLFLMPTSEGFVSKDISADVPH